MSGRTGRRPGGQDTRGDILDAARGLFTEHGFDRTSLRAIAREAGVDPALVHHYFTDKAELFAEALSMPLSPAVVVRRVFDGPVETLGERLLATYIAVWEGPGADRIVAILRSAMTHDDAARMLREFMTATLLRGLGEHLDVDQPELRASLCASQIVGLGVLREVLGFTPLTATDTPALMAWVAPTLQRYLTGPAPSVD